MSYNDVFKVEVETMSHYIFKRDDFLRDVKTLRKKLTNRTCEDFVMEGDPKNVPIDSLYVYMRDIWNVIEQNKDIDIPN